MQQGDDGSDDERLRLLRRGSPRCRGVQAVPSVFDGPHVHRPRRVVAQAPTSATTGSTANTARSRVPGREDRTVNVAAQVAYAYETLSQLTVEFLGPALPLPVQDSALMPSTAAVKLGFRCCKRC